ncbi:NADPH-dependent FMN reductase [Dehalococcoides mccartyi]|jgi:multimeric flavodoxin WrbA|uniref:flavodoxin family protein n=1 Tax=Dehalococcoides mccartyi TaxID=61435 RepID=UPI0002B76EBA|nr:flavodoxin family protein [Dehalococcoides mccartyi]AGG08053.1 flavoprotein [Dehalococcoides mccartyi BTF08]KSV17486.1 NADPH-dependent FMN reductase [Dehalococcoides mccartyi]
MNIVFLMGSPRRNGSTSALTEEILKGANEKEVNSVTYYLNELNIRGCQSCNACVMNSSVACSMNDDVNKILYDISEADGVIFATPVYMASMSGQMKLMLDRMRPFTRSDNSSKMKPGKKTIWAVTQRNTDETRYIPVFEKLLLPMKFLGFEESKILIVSGTTERKHILEQKDKLNEAYRLGRWLTE